MSNKSSNKFINFLNGKTFYVVLCCCFVAVGIAAWAGVEGMRADVGEDTSDPAGLSASIPDTAETEDREGTDSSSSGSKSDVESITGNNTEADSSFPDSTISSDSDDAATAGGTVAAFFIPPVIGDSLKDFSDTELQYSMTYGDMRLHKALDIAAEAGAPVTASGEGEVVDIYNDPLLGTTVEIDHGNNITVCYCGLNAVPTVEIGDTVDSSTQIGTVDVIPCESVEPRHLHIEFYLDGVAVSPSKYFTAN